MHRERASEIFSQNKINEKVGKPSTKAKEGGREMETHFLDPVLLFLRTSIDGKPFPNLPFEPTQQPEHSTLAHLVH